MGLETPVPAMLNRYAKTGQEPARAEERATRLAVVGMGRSGTTLVTEALEAGGVFLGSVNWAGENESARAINDAYLEQYFGARPGLPYGRLPRGEIRVADERWRERARRFIAEMDAQAAGYRYWAFKDPRTTILADLWMDHLDLVIGVFRRPEAVAESYLAHSWVDGLRPRHRALEYWRRFNESLIRLHDSRPDTLLLIETAQDFIRQMRGVLNWLGLDGHVLAEHLFDPARQPASDGGDLPSRYRLVYEELVRRRSFP